MLTFEEGARKVVQTCAGLRSDDRVLVVYDQMANAAPAWALRRAARDTGAKAHVRYAEHTHGSCGFDRLVDEVADADIVIAFTHRSFITSLAADRIVESGGRLLAFTKASERTLLTGAIEADFPTIAPRCHELADRFSEATELEIETRAGTKVSTSLAGRSGMAATGIVQQKGAVVRLPYVGAIVAPVERSVEGAFVVDKSTSFGLVDSPITLTVEGGEVVSVSGGAAARRFEENLGRRSVEGRMVSLLGCGLNPAATVVGLIDQDIGALGTGHAVVGSNKHVPDGENPNTAFSEFVYDAPTVTLNGIEVVRRGELVCG